MNTEKKTEIEEILKQYEIGELLNCDRNDRGFVNTSFEIETLAEDGIHKYFLRKYKKGIKKEELEFEHSLINYLKGKKFAWVAGLLKTKDGQSYIHRMADENDQEGVFFAVFEYLDGEDKFTWVDPICCDEELTSAAEVLAQYHNAVFDFLPQGRRSEPKIIDLLPELLSLLSGARQRTKNTIFDTCLIEHSRIIQKNIEDTLSTIREPECAAAAKLAIHCDYHPGNLKFLQKRVVGLFDFDWSKIDFRSFDVGQALFYFFTSWGEEDGALRLKDIALFLNAYQITLKGMPGIGPLNAAELKYLPQMICAANLYALNWTITDFYQKDVDPQEYLVYLRHSVNFIRWIEKPKNRDELANTFLSIHEG